MSTYTSNIPQANQNPSDSQPLLLANFTALGTAIAQNHVDMSDTTNRGKHNFLQMPEQASDAATAANEGAVYTKDAGTQPELYWRNESNGTVQQMTNSVPNTVAPNRDWSFADGLQLRLGTIAHTGTSTAVIFSSAFSTAAYAVFLTPIGAAGLITGWNAQSLTTTGFTVASTSAGGGNSFYYVAIGS